MKTKIYHNKIRHKIDKHKNSNHHEHPTHDKTMRYDEKFKRKQKVKDTAPKHERS